MKGILFEKNLDENTKWLIEQIINSFNLFTNSNLSHPVDKGLPLGNATSQLFSNILLNKFDQFVKHKLKAKYYIRYCDDFIIVSKDKEYLESLISQIALFLKDELSLNLHPRKVEIRKLSQGIDFLGYVVLPYYKVLRTNTKKRIFRRMKDGFSKETKQSYLGMLSHCKGYKIAKQFENEVKSAIL